MSKVLADKNGFEYYEQLPETAIRCADLHEFFRVKTGKKEWKKENLEPKIGIYFLVYSPNTKKYYLRRVHEMTNFKNLIQYAEDGNLYIFNK